MSAPGPGLPWTAFAVGIDASEASAAALEAAATLARRLGRPVRLEAVCVADADIARLAGHPGAVALCSLTARARPLALKEQAIATDLAAQVRAARRAAEATGARAAVAFHERHGPVSRELASFVRERGADLLVLGWTGRARARWRRGGAHALGSSARHLVETAPAEAVLVVRGEPADPPVLLVAFDGGPGARRALETAAALAGPDGRETGQIDVLLLGDPARLRPQAEALLAARGIGTARLHALPDPTADSLAEAAAVRGAILLLPGEVPRTLGVLTGDLIDRLTCSVLLLR